MEITLSIDIGGTNIKAALLPSNISDITEESLWDTTVIYKKTQGWMNKSLPKIVDRDYYASILYHFRDANITQILINGPFKCKSPVEIDRTDYYVKDFEVPTKFVEKASHLAGLPVTIQNDAQAWINGITAYWLRIKKMELDYPIFAIILGTGIALATAISPEKTKIIELSKTKYHKNVHQASDQWSHDTIHSGHFKYPLRIQFKTSESIAFFGYSRFPNIVSCHRTHPKKFLNCPSPRLDSHSLTEVENHQQQHYRL